MTISSDHVGPSVGENLRTILAEESGEVTAVGFDEESTGELIEILAESEEPPRVRLLVGGDVLKWLRDDFMLASTAAELLDAGTLAVRASEQLDGTLVVADEAIISLLRSDSGHSAAFVTDEEEFVAAVRERWNSLWEDGEAFNLRTPAYSQVLDSLGDEFSSEVQSDFQTMLESVENMDDDMDELDEVGLSLLVAAKHEQLLYDISHWGEDADVASKATFSRKKTLFEEQGLLETEKVPIDVGRPRLRLLLGEERLREADADELASVAHEMLSAVPA
ncbi:DUF5821 family protein (plasmid) [Halococcus dombrowskii]|uniref:DUF5821 family protein n=1 Tax=Halococcus dombrowskii TaxID=179637 RepID=A0AAV3SKD2_HALDO|nr:DUF5821 family protein [Halococcus dombrowskii]UOO97373.1 DUF5821 family protein [Halococcus dombrowskii]